MIGTLSIANGLQARSLRPFVFPRRQYYFTANGFRPRIAPVRKPGGLRKATSEAGEDETGHISTGPKEGIFFLDSKYVVVNRDTVELTRPQMSSLSSFNGSCESLFSMPTSRYRACCGASTILMSLRQTR